MKPMYRWMLSVLLFGSGALTAQVLGAGSPAASPATPKTADQTVHQDVAFDNPRVTVKQITLSPGASRPTRTRETDELVLFPEEAHYLAVAPDGKRERRDRQPGAVAWHKKGEVAPTLVNDGDRTVRYFSISIK